MENNQRKLWFRAKRFGLGWYPISWQGWAVLALYILALIPHAIIANRQHSGSDFLINFAPNFIVLTTFLLIICHTTGEKLGWRWGQRSK